MDQSHPAPRHSAQPPRANIACPYDTRDRPIYCRAVQHTIETIVSASLRVSPESLNSPKRGSQAAVRIRHIALYLAHVEGRLSLTETGRLFARDRRAVAYAVAQIEQRRDDDPGFDRAMTQWSEALQRHLGDLEVYLGWTWRTV